MTWGFWKVQQRRGRLGEGAGFVKVPHTLGTFWGPEREQLMRGWGWQSAPGIRILAQVEGTLFHPSISDYLPGLGL